MPFKKSILLPVILFSLFTAAQKQDIVLHYFEDFTDGTHKPWRVNNQFGFASDYGSMYGTIQTAGKKDKDLNFPFPEFNNAAGVLGKDFTISIKLGNNAPGSKTEPDLYAGFRIQLTGEYQIGLAVNGINSYQIIGLGKNEEALFMTGTYSGHQQSGKFAFSELSVTKKNDSLIFSVNKIPVFRCRPKAKEAVNQQAFSDYAYNKAFFYAGFTGESTFKEPYSYVIDDFELTWLSRKGDELLSEKLLQDELKKYARYSKPVFGKYIFAEDKDGANCVLNKYGNTVIEPSNLKTQYTSDPGIFIRAEGRDEMYNAMGDFVEFSAAKTKALMASAKTPVYLQQEPLLEPLYFVKLNPAYNELKADEVLTVCRPLGIFKNGGLKGVTSISGTVYIKPWFDEIRVKKITGDTTLFTNTQSEYCFWVKKGNDEWLIPFEGARENLLLSDQIKITYCDICKGFGNVEGETRHESGEYVPAKLERVTFSYDDIYTSMYGDKWKTTYTTSYTVTSSPGYFKPGKIIRTSVPCSKCKATGISEKIRLTLIWNDVAKFYSPKWVKE